MRICKNKNGFSYQDIDSVAKIIAVKFGGIIVLSAVIDQVLLAEVFGFLF